VSPYRVPGVVEVRGPRWGVTPTKRLKYHWRRFVLAVFGGWTAEVWPLYRQLHRMKIENERMQQKIRAMKFDMVLADKQLAEVVARLPESDGADV
jgi:hypothetical protein